MKERPIMKHISSVQGLVGQLQCCVPNFVFYYWMRNNMARNVDIVIL